MLMLINDYHTDGCYVGYENRAYKAPVTIVGTLCSLFVALGLATLPSTHISI